MDNTELKERFDKLEKLLLSNKTVLTFDEACEYTGISRSYLYKLTSLNIVPFSKPNGKLVYFEKDKLDEWLLQNRSKSKREMELEALGHTLNNPRS